jgi:8-oxo-dGTP pyrophosphatase MutT (NUDIX family)
MPHYHPKRRANGDKVTIHQPSRPSEAANWMDADAIVTIVPGGETPVVLNGIALQPVTQPRRSLDWSALAETSRFAEPEFAPLQGLKPAAGALVIEPGNRIWIVHPTNAFGGYRATFPKGTVGPGDSLRTTALREVFEETGLLVKLIGWLTDSHRTQSCTRYYLARRIGGSPADMGWESQAVSLVPRPQLASLLNQPVDHAIVHALGR